MNPSIDLEAAKAASLRLAVSWWCWRDFRVRRNGDHVIKPWRRATRKKSVVQALKRTAAAPAENLRETANSYFGLLGQASHSQKDRAALANLVLRRGHVVNGALTKTYPKR